MDYIQSLDTVKESKDLQDAIWFFHTLLKMVTNVILDVGESFRAMGAFGVHFDQFNSGILSGIFMKNGVLLY